MNFLSAYTCCEKCSIIRMRIKIVPIVPKSVYGKLWKEVVYEVSVLKWLLFYHAPFGVFHTMHYNKGIGINPFNFYLQLVHF